MATSTLPVSRYDEPANPIERLSIGFARDELSLEEFEIRIDRAYTVASTSELSELLTELSVAQHPIAVVQSPQERQAQITLALTGSVARP